MCAYKPAAELPSLLCVTNKNLCTDDFLERISLLSSCGSSAVLLREKDLSDQEYEALARRCLSICQANNCRLILRGHEQFAIQSFVRFVHYSASEFLSKELADPSLYCGVSVHSAGEAVLMEQKGASYLIAGHIFPTDCKKGLPARGLEFLKEVCASVSIPVYAIGGITLKTLPDVIRCGAAGVCIMSELMTCSQPKERAAAYTDALSLLQDKTQVRR